MRNMSHKQAIIDLGSNTTRMLIIEVLDSGAYHLVEEDKAVIRLSEGMKDGEIRPKAVSRAVKAARLFKGICDYHKVKKITSVATAAVRESVNRDDVIATLKRETGIEFRVLSRDEEAYYGYLGVINSMDVNDCLTLDLGGGSMEISAVRGRKLVDTVSIPCGAVNITERFFKKDKAGAQDIKAMDSYLKEWLKEVKWLKDRAGSPLIGIGGTVRTIARVDQRLKNYPFDELHNYHLSSTDIGSIFNRLKGMTVDERKDVPGVSRDRADIIVGGVAAVNTLVRYLKVPLIRVSSCGLRDGLFFSEYLGKPVTADITRFSVDNLSGLYRVDKAHAKIVAKLADSLFDELSPLHGLKEPDRRLLWLSASLHELGYYYDYGKRFNNTFYGIIDNTIFGLTHVETYKVALIASMYGAGGLKSRSAFLNGSLGKDDTKAVRRLGVILGIADGLDRSRGGNVSSIQCDIGKDKVTLTPVHKNDIDIEMLTVEDMSQYFKKAFDRELVFENNYIK